jgi:hypothetical protein
MPVELAVEGPATEVRVALAPAVHRIVQEALTNTLRHAGPVPTEVRVAVTTEQVEVVVRDHRPLGGAALPGWRWDGRRPGAGGDARARGAVRRHRDGRPPSRWRSERVLMDGPIAGPP